MPSKKRYKGESKKAYNRRRRKKGASRDKANKSASKKYKDRY